MRAPAAWPWLWALLAGSIALTLYGSWVPFVWRERPWPVLLESLEMLWRRGWMIQSRSDFAVNILLGFPLGLATTGLLTERLMRRGGHRGLGLMLAWLGCVGLATAVEFSQLFVRGRVTAWSDVAAQALGAAMGGMVWLARGVAWLEPGCAQLNAAIASRMLFPWLIPAVGLWTLATWWPLDFELGLGTLAHRYRDPLWQAGLGRWHPVECGWTTLMGTAVGLLAGAAAGEVGLVERGWPGSLITSLGFGGGVLLVLGLECGQWTVSRQPSFAEAAAGAVGWMVGWSLGHAGGHRYVATACLLAIAILTMLLCGGPGGWIWPSRTADPRGYSVFLPSALLGWMIASDRPPTANQIRRWISVGLIVGFSGGCVLETLQGWQVQATEAALGQSLAALAGLTAGWFLGRWLARTAAINPQPLPRTGPPA